MPVIDFQHTPTGKVDSVYLTMDAPREYAGPNGDQKGEWVRLWSVPNAAVDTKLDPHSAADFVKATNKKGGTLGELYDRAAELSHERASKEGGIDHVKQSFYADYKRRHKGVAHPQEARDAGQRRLREAGIDFDLDQI